MLNAWTEWMFLVLWVWTPWMCWMNCICVCCRLHYASVNVLCSMHFYCLCSWGLDFPINNRSFVSHVLWEGRGHDRCVDLNFLFFENRQIGFLRPKPLSYSFKLIVQNFYQDNNLSIMSLSLYFLFIYYKF